MFSPTPQKAFLRPLRYSCHERAAASTSRSGHPLIEPLFSLRAQSPLRSIQIRILR
jgi:hypothetical protein